MIRLPGGRPKRVPWVIPPSFIAVVAASFSISLGSAVEVTLSRESAILPETGVPLLHEVLPEHRLSGEGLILVPEKGPYEWSQAGPEAAPFRLRLGVDSAYYDRASLTIWNWHNHAVWQGPIEGGAEEVLPIRIAGTGSYLLTLDGWKNGEVKARLIRNLAVTRDQNAVRGTWKTDEFFVGVCAFPGRYHWETPGGPALPRGLTEEEARSLEASLIAKTGLQVVRTDESLEMGRRTSADGGESYHFDFSRMDPAVGAFTSRGFQLVLQTMSAADWAVLPAYAGEGKNRWRYPHLEAPQRAYLAALVERYGKHARIVQISNEPDQTGYWSGTNAEFSTQYRFSREEVKSVAPHLPVTTGGYSLVDLEKCATLIQDLHSLVDLPAYNAHGNLDDYKRSFATMRRLQEEAGDAKTRWVNTEAGYSAWRLEQERRQAQIDTQKVLYSWASGHSGILLFCSRMTRGPGRDGPPDFGLLDHQYCPRFVYASISALLGTLAGAEFRETLAERGNVHLYLFSRGDDLILAGFTLGDDPDKVTIDCDAERVTPVDEMGNVLPGLRGGRFEADLDGYPRYWLLHGATRATERR